MPKDEPTYLDMATEFVSEQQNNYMAAADSVGLPGPRGKAQADVMKLQHKTGLPQDTVTQGKEELDGQIRTQETYEALQGDPDLYQWERDMPGRLRLIDDPKELSRFGKYTEAWAEGWRTNAYADLGFEAFQNVGQISPGLQRRIDKLEATLGTDFGATNHLDEAAIEGLRMAPGFLSSIAEGIRIGLPAAAAVSALNAVAGQLGPQALTPEELVTVPLGGGVAMGWGMVAGMGTRSFQLETGPAFLEYMGMESVGPDGKKYQMDPHAAWTAALLSGVGVAGLEVVAIRKLLQYMPGGKQLLLRLGRKPLREALKSPSTMRAFAKFGRRWAGTWSWETGTEVIQEGLIMAGGELAKNLSEQANRHRGDKFERLTFPGMTVSPEAWQQSEFGSRLIDTFDKAGHGTFFMSGIGPTISLGVDVIQAKRSQAAVGDYKELVTETGKSELFQKYPEEFEKWAEARLAKGEDPNVYFDARGLATFFQSADVEEPMQILDALGVSYQDLQEGLTGGVNLVVPISKFMTQMQGNEHLEGFLANLREHPSAPTPLESTNYLQTQEKRVKAALEQQEIETKKSAALIEASERVFTDISKRLSMIPGHSKSVIEVEATLWRSFFRTQATLSKMDPWELYETFQTTIQMADAGVVQIGGDGQTYFQSDMDTALGVSGQVPITLERLTKQFETASSNVNAEDAQALAGLVRGMANYLGMDVNEYVESRFQGVVAGGEPASDSLFTRSLKIPSQWKVVKTGEKGWRGVGRWVELKAGWGVKEWRSGAMAFEQAIDPIGPGRSGGQQFENVLDPNYVSMAEYIRDVHGDQDAEIYLQKALRYMADRRKRFGKKGAMRGQVVGPNAKTMMSIDVSNICPFVKGNKQCAYCYVGAARIEGTRGKSTLDPVEFTDDLILDMPDDVVQFFNKKMGGLRMYSFSDFEPHTAKTIDHILKLAKKRGLNIKAITKQKEFVDTFAKKYRKNLWINISTDMEVAFIKDVFGVDGEEALGIRSLISNAPTTAEAVQWKGKHKNVVVRAVSLNDDDTIRYLHDDRVRVITGYHGRVKGQLVKTLRLLQPGLELGFVDETGKRHKPRLGKANVKKFADAIKNQDPETLKAKLPKAEAEKLAWKMCCQGVQKCGLCPVCCGKGKADTLYRIIAGEPIASVEFDADGKALIRALKDPSVVDMAHELGHIFRRDLNVQDLDRVEAWLGVPRSFGTSGKGKEKGWGWTVEHEEKFARGFEQYLLHAGQKTMPPGMKKVFKGFRRWILAQYGGMIGFMSSAKLHAKPINLEVIEVFNKMAIGTDPAFAAWFKESKVTKEGAPRAMAHGSNHPGIDIFRPGTHFGTAQSAYERIRAKNLEQGGLLYPVYLSIQNPIRMTDHEQDTTRDRLATARKKGVITPEEYEVARSKIDRIYAGLEVALTPEGEVAVPPPDKPSGLQAAQKALSSWPALKETLLESKPEGMHLVRADYKIAIQSLLQTIIDPSQTKGTPQEGQMKADDAVLAAKARASMADMTGLPYEVFTVKAAEEAMTSTKVMDEWLDAAITYDAMATASELKESLAKDKQNKISMEIMDLYNELGLTVPLSDDNEMLLELDQMRGKFIDEEKNLQIELMDNLIHLRIWKAEHRRIITSKANLKNIMNLQEKDPTQAQQVEVDSLWNQQFDIQDAIEATEGKISDINKELVQYQPGKFTSDEARSQAGAEVVMNLLLSKGIDGLVYKNAVEDRGEDSWVIFKPSQVKSLFNLGNWLAGEDDILFQPPSEREAWSAAKPPRGMTKFSDGQSMVTLFKGKHDLSTMLHESGHIFLRIFETLAANPKAPESVREDWDTLLAAARKAVPDLEGTPMQGSTLTRRQTEWIVEKQWEKRYLARGEAPSQELEGAFYRFKAWLLQIYTMLRGRDIEMDPEISAVFDRWLATEQEIAVAEASRDYKPQWKTREESGMDGRTWERYLKLIEKGIREARTRQLSHELEEEQRAKEQWWKSQATEIEKEVTEQVNRMPLQRAAHWLRTGEWLSDPKSEELEHQKLSRSWIEGRYGKEKTKGILEGLGKGKGLLWQRTGGWDGDELAAIFGLRSGDALVQGLLKLEPRSKVIADEVQGRLVDLAKSVDDPAERAIERVHTDARGTWLALELEAIRGLRADVVAEHAAAKRLGKEGLAPAGEYLQAVADAERQAAVATTPKARSEALESLVRAQANLKVAQTLEPSEKRHQGEIEATEAKAARQQREIKMASARAWAAASKKAIKLEKEVTSGAKDSLSARTAKVRTEAKRRIGRLQLMNIKPDRYSGAERQAQRRVEEALLNRTPESLQEAIDAKESALLNHFMFREATRVKAREKAGQRLGAKYTTKKYQQKLGKGGQIYLDQMLRILENVGMKDKASKKVIEGRESWADFKVQMAKEGIEVLVPDKYLEVDVPSYRELTVDEFDGLIDSIKHVAHLASRESKLLSQQRKVDRDTAATELATSAYRNNEIMVSQKSQFPTFLENTRAWGRDKDASLIKIEQLIEWLDGNEIDGPWRQLIWEPIAQAQFAEVKLTEQYSAEFELIIEKLSKKEKEWMYTLHDSKLGSRQKPDGDSWQGHQLLAMALNLGTESNLDKMLRGMTWELSDLMSELERTLTDEHWSMVQSIWNMMEGDEKGGLWKMISDNERKLSGIAPKKLVRRKFTTASGREMTGGYYPMVYDPMSNDRIYHYLQSSEALFEYNFASIETSHGFTEERKQKFASPMLFDLRTVSSHIHKVIHDVTHRETLIDVQKLLRHPEVQNAVADTVGEEYAKALDPWLQGIANGAKTDRVLQGWQNTLRTARYHTSIMAMGWKFTTLITQFAGFSNSVEWLNSHEDRSGEYWMTMALRMFMDDRQTLMREVMSKSAEMANRMRTMDRDIAENAQRLVGQHSVRAKIQRSAFVGIGFADMVVSMPTWVAAYHQALKANRSETLAVQAGDAAVRMSQGGGARKDLTAVQRGGAENNEFMKLFTMFYSYWAAVYSRQRNSMRTVRRSPHHARDFGRFLMQNFYLVIVPSILAEMLGRRGPDWEEEPEEWAKWAARKIAVGVVGPIPIVRDFVQSWETGYSYRATPASAAIESVLFLLNDIEAGVVEGDWSYEKIAKHSSRVVGYSLGLPVEQAVNITAIQVMEMWAGDEEFNLLDIVYRRPREE